MRIAKSKYKHKIQCMRLKPDKVERCLWRLPPLSRQNSPTPEVAPIHISSFLWIGFFWQHNIDGIEFTHAIYIFTLLFAKIFISFDNMICDIDLVKLMINSIANTMQPCLQLCTVPWDNYCLYGYWMNSNAMPYKSGFNCYRTVKKFEIQPKERLRHDFPPTKVPFSDQSPWFGGSFCTPP